MPEPSNAFDVSIFYRATNPTEEVFKQSAAEAASRLLTDCPSVDSTKGRQPGSVNQDLPVTRNPFVKVKLELNHPGTSNDAASEWKSANAFKPVDELLNKDASRGESQLQVWERSVRTTPFLGSNPAILIPALNSYAIGFNPSVTFLGSTNRILGSSMLTALGAYQGCKDWQNLSDSHLSSGKYGLALGADTGMVAGGIISMTRFGPKWLGPTLLLGSIIGRSLLDLIPNKNDK